MPRCNELHTFSCRLRRRARDERGQALVEFALVLPVLILIIMGILYFGRYMNYSNQMTQLAETGARWASVDYQSPGTLQSYIALQASGELANGSSDVTGPLAVYIYYPTGPPANTNKVGDAVRVCVVATVKYPVLLVGGISSTLVATATMRIEVLADAGSWTPGGGSPFTTTIPTACPQT